VAFGLELSGTIEAAPRIPYSRSRPRKWVELYNRSGQRVELADWRLDGGIDFRFGTNDAIPAGGFSRRRPRIPDALRAKFPDQISPGPVQQPPFPFRRAPDVADPADNPADVVDYSDDGHWPEAADAGGASLGIARSPGRQQRRRSLGRQQ
jgi:hypothetical protein